jgi:sec-independent protein translocase protein TatA
MNLGPMEIGLIILAVLLLFGYKKLPDASRSLGRSLRIFKGEMQGLKDDARATPSAPEAQARTASVMPPHIHTTPSSVVDGVS